MGITFPRLFDSLAYSRDMARVIIDTDTEKYPIYIEDSWFFGSRSMRYFSESPIPKETVNEQNRKSNLLFIKCIEEFAGERINDEITSLIGRLNKSAQKEVPAPLTVSKVRAAYKICIASFLDGFRKKAVLGRDTDRIILKTDEDGKPKTDEYGNSRFKVKNIGLGWFNTQATEENKAAVQALKDSLFNEWGSNRVTRAASRYSIDLDAMIKNGDTLRVADINRLILGIADYCRLDLRKCWEQIQDVIKERNPLSILPRRTLRMLAKEFQKDVSDEAGIIDALREAYASTIETSFENIDAKTLFFLQRLVLLDSKELELAFQGRRLEGIVDGLQTSLSAFFIYYPDLEDLERLQMYHMILTAKDSIQEEQLESFFDEILTKGIVKKLMVKDMLVPSPWREETEEGEAPHFYRIEKKLVTGYAKLGYHLVPLGPSTLKDILMYRSTSTAPSTIDPLSTFITDIFPVDPPGYLWRHEGGEDEKLILHTNPNRTIRIMGHSLGGSYSQLILLNQIIPLEDGGFKDDLPERDIEIVTFDSPKINLKCAKDFASWLKHESSEKLRGRISIKHHTSTGDPAPFVGEAYLGAEADPTLFKDLKVVELTPKVREHPALNYHPHGRHFYRTRKDIDFEENEIPINDTTCHKWHIIEVIRRIVGCILFPLLWVYDKIKKLIFGAGHFFDEELTKLWQKIYPQQPESIESIEEAI